jgi:hypothetical protein
LTLAEKVRRTNSPRQVNPHPRIRGQIGIDAKAHQVDTSTRRAKICGQFRIRPIHPARSMEVAGDQHPRRRVRLNTLS